MKRIIGYCIAFLLLTAEVCGKQVKSDLSVLYVGGSPEIETMIHNPEPAVLEKSVRKRTAAFEITETVFQKCRGGQCPGLSPGNVGPL